MWVSRMSVSRMSVRAVKAVGLASQGFGVSSPPDLEAGSELMSSESLDLRVGGKRVVPGIVYLGHIPPCFRPQHVRSLLSSHGEIGRVFFQPEDGFGRGKKRLGAQRRLGQDYAEAWVEFRDKRAAKLVVASLHNTPMGVQCRSPFRYDLWNLKYLHRFSWCHLSQRLAYERQVRQQRVRAEISQAKRETDVYLRRVEKSKHFLQKAEAALAACGDRAVVQEKSWGFIQRPTELEIRKHRELPASPGEERQLQQLMQKARPSAPLLAKIFHPAVEAVSVDLN